MGRLLRSRRENCQHPLHGARELGGLVTGQSPTRKDLLGASQPIPSSHHSLSNRAAPPHGAPLRQETGAALRARSLLQGGEGCLPLVCPVPMIWDSTVTSGAVDGLTAPQEAKSKVPFNRLSCPEICIKRGKPSPSTCLFKLLP